MKRNIVVVCILAILFVISLCEELLVHDTTKKLNTYTSALQTSMQNNNTELDTKEVLDNFDNLKLYWDNKKNQICFFANYDKIRYMDESLIKLNDALKNNDSSLANENLSAVKSFYSLIQYVMGFNINNLF